MLSVNAPLLLQVDVGLPRRHVIPREPLLRQLHLRQLLRRVRLRMLQRHRALDLPGVDKAKPGADTMETKIAYSFFSWMIRFIVVNIFFHCYEMV
jgi:hypothetical protein